MCIIVDVNIAHKILLVDNDPDFGLVRKCLFQGTPYPTKLVYGGKLFEELSKNGSVLKQLLALDQAGRARRISDAEIASEAEAIKDLQLCVSNDSHIIALARASKSRVLCSHDAKLHQDFTNHRLVKSPRGKVYQRAAHIKLVNDSCP